MQDPKNMVSLVARIPSHIDERDHLFDQVCHSSSSTWFPLLREVLEPRYLELPQAEYDEELRKLTPQLQELIDTIDDQSNELRDQTRARLREIVGPHPVQRKPRGKPGHSDCEASVGRA